ncbi:acetyl esterase [Psychrobacter sp. PL15]|uniref:alpha/beta hydrolase n=1 Tax=Psychrobacter sp. PL15 TaxID=3071719 RepID=UPI002E0205CD|nr:acetyl esterase [Psychrobacter sp. PL15]
MPILPISSLNTLVTKTVETAKTKIPARTYQQHAMHYILKGLGKLPTPALERLNYHLKASAAEQYPHADAHLRLILAISNKLKRPLTLDNLSKLRRKFGADAVSLQAPNVWQQKSNGKNISSVSWQDETIADADGGDMTVRCYQAGSDTIQKHKQNLDEVVMLFFHGGGFCIGDLDTHHEFCHTVCTQTGWAVVSVDYRLAPEHTAPTALKDCIAAYAWLTEHCHTLGASPSRIVLSGDSAGGCLAALVAQQVIKPIDALWQNIDEDQTVDEAFRALVQNLPTPLAQLPLYPVTDYDAEYSSWALYGQGLLLDHEDAEVFNTAYIKHSNLPQSHPLVSVIHGDHTQMCPSYIVAAELDILRDEALVYAQQLQDKGINVQTHTVLGAPHGFIHLMSVHQGLRFETNYIIDEFADFVHQLCTATDGAV